MTSRHLHELIDACRSGHEDVGQPELGELARELAQDPKLQRLFERSQRLDAAIRTTFQSVTPPAGLAERLLEAIETASNEERQETPAVAEAESRVELAKRSSRRSFAIWTGAASLSAIATAIAIWFVMPEPISTRSDREIAEDVERWNTELDETDWQTTANIPLRDFPTWQHLAVGSRDRWQWVTKGRIACYDFNTSRFADGATVRLFVLKPTAAVALPGTPPVGYSLPGGWHVGAWQAKGRVYYLAIQAGGDSKRLYSELIAPSGSTA